MTFIKLTLQDGREIHVNAERIFDISKQIDKEGSLVCSGQTEYGFNVNESPEEIIEKIRAEEERQNETIEVVSGEPFEKEVDEVIKYFKGFDSMKEDLIEKKQCPQFPFFGAKYPDASCTDGYLWDLDSYDSDLGGCTKGGEDPCPFCNREEYVQRLKDCEWSEMQIKSNIEYLESKYNK